MKIEDMKNAGVENEGSENKSTGVWVQSQRTRAGDGCAAAATLAQEQCQPRFAGHAVDDQVCRWVAAGTI